MYNDPTVSAAGLSFLLIFLTGVWLTRSGRPINAIQLAIHKLISLLTLALIAMIIRQLWLDGGVSPLEIGAIVVTGYLFLQSILSGGWLSTGKPANAVILTVHKVTPFLTVLATVVTIYLLAVSSQ